MAKTKEGRRRMSTLDFRTEAGRMLFNDLNNPSTSGISPFLESDYQSIRFWKSRPQYQEISFPAFRGQAENMAKIVRAQMTPEAEQAELLRIRKGSGEKKIATPKKDTNSNNVRDGNPKLPGTKLQVQSSVSPLRKNIKVPSLRDTIVAPHPNGEMAIVIFELDGDTDEKACQLQFCKEGQKIMVYSRIPSELTNAASLLGNAENRSSIQDADCMLLDLAIKERLKGSTKDDHGDVWEIREVIDLPFQCKNSFFNKHRKRISTYLLRKNDHGYAWGYFWVVASHVGQQHKGPTKIGCKTTSDEESDHEYDDNSQLSSSDDEEVEINTVESDMDEMEVEFESMEVSEMKTTSTKTHEQELSRLNDGREQEIRELKKCFELKQKQLNLKNEELNRLKDESMCEIAKLRGLIEQEKKQSMETEMKQQNEMQELLRKVSLLENDLEAKENGYLREFAKFRGLLVQEKNQSMKTESERSMKHQSEMEELLRKANLLENELKNEKKQSMKTESERSMKHQSEMEGLLRKANLLENELKNAKDKDRKIKDLQAKENDNKRSLENCRQNIERLESNIERLESKMERLKVDNQLKQQYILELEQCCETKGQDLLRSEQAFKRRLAEMAKEISKYTQLLQESDEKMVILENDNAKKLQASFDKIQGIERLLFEKDQQNVYQMDQIERLTCHVAEIGQATLEKDSLIHRYLQEIQGLKKHVLQQRDVINQLESQLEAHERRSSRNGVRLTDGLRTDEERNLEFGDLNRWDSDKSIKAVSPKNPHSDKQEDASCENHRVKSDGTEHFKNSVSDDDKENVHQNTTIGQERPHKTDDAEASTNKNRGDGASARSTTDLPTDEEQHNNESMTAKDTMRFSPNTPNKKMTENDKVSGGQGADEKDDNGNGNQIKQSSSHTITEEEESLYSTPQEKVLNPNMTSNEDYFPILNDAEMNHSSYNTPTMEAQTTGEQRADEKHNTNGNQLNLPDASSYTSTEKEEPPPEETSEDNTERYMSIDLVTKDQESKTTELSQLQNMVVQHEKKSKKRKSVTNLHEEHPNKRIRKSRRLQEKRLAKLKAKTD